MFSNYKPECLGTNCKRRDAYDMMIKINFTENTEISLKIILILVFLFESVLVRIIKSDSRVFEKNLDSNVCFNFSKTEKRYLTSDSLSAIVVLMMENRSYIGINRPVRQQLYVLYVGDAAFLKKELLFNKRDENNIKRLRLNLWFQNQ